MNNIKCIFDLDGTVTSQETLPLIAEHFGVQEEIAELTRQTIRGNVPFIESFIKRVHILGRLPVSEINELLGDVQLYGLLHKFITSHADKCAIATGNLSCWVDKLTAKYSGGSQIIQKKLCLCALNDYTLAASLVRSWTGGENS